ncbi:hypothetical protein [Persicobacter psychrovividus]|uniref:Uncharacterized protein n=1 Tax=Persicobacter psychrovividus TaxID=387638 RepID=A0ABM7VE95_9BACT|nr:hypothetical protein PEPS_15500 [Persicobacter psychrovividus]
MRKKLQSTAVLIFVMLFSTGAVFGIGVDERKSKRKKKKKEKTEWKKIKQEQQYDRSGFPINSNKGVEAGEELRPYVEFKKFWKSTMPAKPLRA